MVPSWVVALPRLLLLLVAPFHVGRLWSRPLLDEPSVDEGLLIEVIGGDCGLPPIIPERRLLVTNATIDVLSSADGISLELGVAIDEEPNGDAWSSSSGTVVQMIRAPAGRAELGGGNASECRTLLLRLRNESLYKNFQNPVRLRVQWLHAGLAKVFSNQARLTNYNITVTTFSLVANSYVGVDILLHTTVFVNNDWPKLVAVHTVRSCSSLATVRISFSPNDDYRQYLIGLCDINPNVDCAKEMVINKPATSAVFYDVEPWTYKVHVGAKESPGNCYCTQDESSGDCVICGSSLSRAYYTVTESAELKPRNGSIIARATYNTNNDRCCLLVKLSQDETMYDGTVFNVTLRDSASHVLIWTTILESVPPKNVKESHFCGIDTSNIVVEAMPTGNCFLSSEPVLVPLLTEDLCSGISLPTWIGVAAACSVAAIALVVGIVVVLRSKKLTVQSIFGTKGAALAHREQRGPSVESKRKTFRAADIELLFGGSCPVILLLYSNDNDLHVRAITKLAVLLHNFGQFRVVIDRWCDPEAVQMYGWLGTNMRAAKKVIVVASEGVLALHMARRGGKVYAHHAAKYPFYHHVTDALEEASTTPELRRKLIFVAFPYTTTACVQSLCECLPDSGPCYRLPDEMSLLVGVLHDAASGYRWSSLEYYETSREVQDLHKLLQKMQTKIDHDPKWMSFGPLEDVLEWPIEHAEPSRNFQRGSISDTIARNTIAVTVACSGSTTGNDMYDSGIGQTDILQFYGPSALRSLALLTSADQSYDDMYCSLETSAKSSRILASEPPRPSTAELRTEMPAVEEIWETYLAPEPSPRSSVVGSLTSAQLRAALHRLNSNSPDEELPGGSSDGSRASCITLDLPCSSFHQTSLSCTANMPGTYSDGLCESTSGLLTPLLQPDKIFY